MAKKTITKISKNQKMIEHIKRFFESNSSYACQRVACASKRILAYSGGTHEVDPICRASDKKWNNRVDAYCNNLVLDYNSYIFRQDPNIDKDIKLILPGKRFHRKRDWLKRKDQFRQFCRITIRGLIRAKNNNVFLFSAEEHRDIQRAIGTFAISLQDKYFKSCKEKDKDICNQE